MTYLLLSAVFLALAAIVAAVAWRNAPPGHLIATAVTVTTLIVLTAVFDTVMIATGLFAYADEHISGVRIGLAPVEDFAYPIAGVLLLTGLWTLMTRQRDAD
ncbi:lycopene cyclase domain-containing protein [Agromyces humatus]|uniref:Lycopene cyclase domain-containing protein n=1 Tax=Agromyces humatus TaxID=279573 RepID=A0ABN2KTY0_9MICO|nr:lycopene cyclase domain-containing protein [Agromyces humatus]